MPLLNILIQKRSLYAGFESVGIINRLRKPDICAASFLLYFLHMFNPFMFIDTIDAHIYIYIYWVSTKFGMEHK